MNSKSYHTKTSDSSSYVSGYDIFLSRTNFRKKILEKFKDSVPENLMFNGTLRLIDIGCGNGQMTKRYIEIIKDVFKNSNIEAYLLEPSKESLGRAKEEVSSLVNEVIEINQTAEEYFQSANQESFDLIIASHVFYHIPIHIVPNIVRSLKHNGVMSIMMGAKIHPLRIHPDLKSISKHGNSDELKELLSNLIEKGAISSNLISVKTDMDLKGLWNQGNLSEDGKKFFAFTYNTEMDNFPTASKLALDQVLEEAFTNQNGCIHPSHEIIWVKKS